MHTSACGSGFVILLERSLSSILTENIAVKGEERRNPVSAHLDAFVKLEFFFIPLQNNKKVVGVQEP